MEHLVPYFSGIILMLAIQLWVQHRHKQYYKYVIYMTLVLWGAYQFSQHLVAGRGIIYVVFLTVVMALAAAFITRTYLGKKLAGTK